MDDKIWTEWKTSEKGGLLAYWKHLTQLQRCSAVKLFVAFCSFSRFGKCHGQCWVSISHNTIKMWYKLVSDIFCDPSHENVKYVRFHCDVTIHLPNNFFHRLVKFEPTKKSTLHAMLRCRATNIQITTWKKNDRRCCFVVWNKFWRHIVVLCNECKSRVSTGCAPIHILSSVYVIFLFYSLLFNCFIVKSYTMYCISVLLWYISIIQWNYHFNGNEPTP